MSKIWICDQSMWSGWFISVSVCCSKKAPWTGVCVSFSPLSIRMLVFEGTLVIVIKFGSNAKNELWYNGQPSKLVHLSDDSDDVDDDDNGEKNDFAFSIKVGFKFRIDVYVSILVGIVFWF